MTICSEPLERSATSSQARSAGISLRPFLSVVASELPAQGVSLAGSPGVALERPALLQRRSFSQARRAAGSIIAI
jgi:hypothetical protein